MAKELIFSATKNDFRVDVFRSGGPGGQHQNKTNSGVRITHIESGLSSESRESRHQKINKIKAFNKLAKLLLAYYTQDDAKNRYYSTETVRTYNKPDNRVKDHLSGHMMTYEEVVGKGNIGPMIETRLITKNSEEK